MQRFIAHHRTLFPQGGRTYRLCLSAWHASLRSRRQIVHAQTRDNVTHDDDFFGSSHFDQMGLRDDIAACLKRSGFEIPSRAQQQSLQPLRQGNSVVLAAETGSGKTLAYLIPLIDRMLRERVLTVQQHDDPLIPPPPEGMLVLCPNAVLCDQVMQVVSSIFGDMEDVKPAVVSGQNPPPYEFPNVVITTPGALHSLLFGSGGMLGDEWTREGLGEWARYVVLDEADMLLGGSYGKHIDGILDILRTGDRRRAAERACEEVGLSINEYWELPRHVRKAAQLYGGKGMVDEGVSSCVGRPVSVDSSAATIWLRQYVFVAATMPSEGKETVGYKIKMEFPTATWVMGNQLHKTKRLVDFLWRYGVEHVEEKVDEVERIVLENDTSSEEHSDLKMLIFVGNGRSAQHLFENMQARFCEPNSPIVLAYHSGLSSVERAEALRKLQDAEGKHGVILISTDAASRGVDVPNVSHVVHADFAASAIDFLHRSGRTGRAGKRGKVISFVDSSSKDLAGAIQSCMEAGEPVEGAFSRNRSFRKKFKRYGKYVPRGNTT